MLTVSFLKGKKDNPKVNALLLVKGNSKKTHKESFKQYQDLLLKLAEERQKQKELEESFFKENEWDYEESVDGRCALNRLLTTSYAFEGMCMLVLASVFSFLPK